MKLPVIGFLGFGEAAQCFAARLADLGGFEVLAFCDGPTNAPPYSERFRALATKHGVALVDRLDELAQADIIFSAVVVATACEAGESIAAHMRAGALLVDINASTPAMKQRVAAAVAAKGCEFVDANPMGAIGLYGFSVPLYTSGDGAERFAQVFGELGFTIAVAGPRAGTAAAVKMLRSVVTKGMEALLIEALTAASLAGVRPEALRGICEPMDTTSLSKFADMCVRTDVLHAERRAVEMEGIVEGLLQIGIDPVMTIATAKRLRASAGYDLRQEFSARDAYTADDVLDGYVRKAAALRETPRCAQARGRVGAEPMETSLPVSHGSATGS